MFLTFCVECGSLSFVGPLAHLARAPALHAGGDRFESDRVHHNCILSFSITNLDCIPGFFGDYNLV